jgi:hypothetical protein
VHRGISIFTMRHLDEQAMAAISSPDPADSIIVKYIY